VSDEYEHPFMVGQADELRFAFQRGDEQAMLAIIGLGRTGGIQRSLIAALEHMDERTATYAAPYIADLAKRIAWLLRDQARITEWTPPYSAPRYPVGDDEIS
jgi:hypothetical protein